MYKPINISLSGPAISFLLYENSKCSFQQEGFLLGEIIETKTTTITDNDQEQVNVSKIIKINSVVPCPQVNYFYNAIGKINKNKIRHFLGNEFANVVAWYSYKQLSSFKFTLREKLIHKQLSDFFEIPLDSFSCCLLIIESSDNLSTHLYSQTFMRFNSTGYDSLPIHIVNLSEPNNTYKTSEPASETFNNILSDLKIDTKKMQGIVVISRIQNALQKHIDNVIGDLSEAEKRLHELEIEVGQLQEKRTTKKQYAVSYKEQVVEEQANDLISFNSKPSSPDNSPEFPRKNLRGKDRGKGRKKGSRGSSSGSGVNQKNNHLIEQESPRLRRRN